MQINLIGKETIEVSAGKFNCLILEPVLREDAGLFKAQGSLKVWVTDDERKMPVKMKVEVFIGSVSAELLEYQRQAPENIL